MLQEVPVVCPRCEMRRVERVVPNVCEIRHSGHYELMCKTCVSIVIEQHKPPKDDVPDLFSIIGAMTSRKQVCFRNLKLINEGQ